MLVMPSPKSYYQPVMPLGTVVVLVNTSGTESVYVYANRLPAIATPALKEGRPHRATYGTAKHQGLFRFMGLDRMALARSVFGQFCH